MSVNLSVKQLQHSDIVGDVRDALEDVGLRARARSRSRSPRR